MCVGVASADYLSKAMSKAGRSSTGGEFSHSLPARCPCHLVDKSGFIILESARRSRDSHLSEDNYAARAATWTLSVHVSVHPEVFGTTETVPPSSVSLGNWPPILSLSDALVRQAALREGTAISDAQEPPGTDPLPLNHPISVPPSPQVAQLQYSSNSLTCTRSQTLSLGFPRSHTLATPPKPAPPTHCHL